MYWKKPTVSYVPILSVQIATWNIGNSNFIKMHPYWGEIISEAALQTIIEQNYTTLKK